MVSLEGFSANASQPFKEASCAIRTGLAPAVGERSSIVVPWPDALLEALLLKLQTIKSPAVMFPAVTGAMASPYGLLSPLVASTVDPIVVIVESCVITPELDDPEEPVPIPEELIELLYMLPLQPAKTTTPVIRKSPKPLDTFFMQNSLFCVRIVALRTSTDSRSITPGLPVSRGRRHDFRGFWGELRPVEEIKAYFNGMEED
jgi:hypothetical protein